MTSITLIHLDRYKTKSKVLKQYQYQAIVIPTTTASKQQNDSSSFDQVFITQQPYFLLPQALVKATASFLIKFRLMALKNL